MRATDCALVVTDTGHRATCSPGSTWATADGRVLATDTRRVPGPRSTTGPRLVATSPPGTARTRRPLPAGVHLGFHRHPQGGPDVPGRAARAALRMPFAAGRRPLLRPCRCSTATRSASSLLPAFASGRHPGPAPAVLGVGLPRRRPPARRHLLQHRRPGDRLHRRHPARPTHDRDHRLKFVLGPETSAADKAEFTRALRCPDLRGLRVERGTRSCIHPVARRPARAPWARPSGSDDVAVVDPDTGEERPPRALRTPTVT